MWIEENVERTTGERADGSSNEDNKGIGLENGNGDPFGPIYHSSVSRLPRRGSCSKREARERTRERSIENIVEDKIQLRNGELGLPFGDVN